MISLLSGIRVIECAWLPTGDNTSRLLGDLGADVIKIERPGQGDYLRVLGGLMAPENSPFHLVCNRNKRSVELNLRDDRGRAIFFDLLKTADIFIDGFASDACDKLGIGYQEQCKVKPDIIYCQANGFGRRGKYGKIPGHGYQFQSVGGGVALKEDDEGLMWEQLGGGDFPQYFGGSLDGPLVAAIYAAMTALAALEHRKRTGEGVFIDTAACDAVIALQQTDAVVQWNYDKIYDRRQPPPPFGTSPHERPKYSHYKCKDGKNIQLGAIEPKFWVNLCKAIGREDLMGQHDMTLPIEFFGSDPQLIYTLRDVFLTKTAQEWVDIACLHDIPIVPTNSKMEVLDDPHLKERDAFEIKDHPAVGKFAMPGWPAMVEGQRYETVRPAPALGEHTAEVLAEVGLGAAELEKLKAAGVV
ncbi:CaiB/BaiF CoA transferase family protein [Sphingopyxis macrogoltabida]|uniref:Acyl-CoA hydratase n=1 Tax=Sphingopyxis macrogoltabida TaxID=33050 RepID=A0AAC9AZ30_SPHMC|nr:CaiB/BaiF CoA-transferase family protein [Sphingopyxis macrogoltabida]ALJ16373.1 acyl-CoA hydratase [Sphingopyxis macrogoltabida]AMU92607.1 acyl-CoA hydratase [Sphingopyxis macrogoltabida]